MGEDVLVEVIINGRDMLQFYSTPDHYQTLYEDRQALVNTVKTAFKEGLLTSKSIKDIEDIESVKFLSEVTEESIEVTKQEEVQEVDAQEGEEYEAYEIIEETAMDNLTSSELPEELIIDVGLSSGVSKKAGRIKGCNSAGENERNGVEEMECEEEESPKGIEYSSDAPYVEEFGVQVHVVDSQGISSDERSQRMRNQIENETEEVVNEEHVITTPMEEGDYEILEEYEEGVVVNGTGESGTSESEIEGSKSRKLGFLNKNQTEKLKEFKRLLQEGTQISQGPQVVRQYRAKEEKTGQPSADADNASEKTESCTEDPGHEEDFQESQAADENKVRESIVVQSHNKKISSTTNENEEQMEVMMETSSVLIVDTGRHDSDGNEYEVYEIEEIDVEAEPEAEEEVEVPAPPPTEGLPKTQMCELCGYETFTLADLKLHIGFHTGENLVNSFSCDLCVFKALRKMDVSRHKAIFHGESLPERLSFVCRTCRKRSASKEEFLRHLETHKPTPVLKCKICDLKVKSHDELRNHSRNHIGEEPFECYYCAYMTARKCHLRKHMKRRHRIDSGGKGPPPYACYTCDYHTIYRSDFHKHLEAHKEEYESISPPKIFKCSYDHCRFLTLDEHVYKNHLHIHQSNRYREKSNRSNEGSSVTSQDTSRKDVLSERVPLKERVVNVPEEEDPKTVKGQKTNSTSLLNSNLPKKSLIREDYSPLKRRRKGLKSLVGKVISEPIIETQLKRKFNFDVKNLSSPSPDEYLNGFNVTFFGEVLKSHGCLRKYTRYGEVIKKSENDLATVMANPENERQLRRIYDQLKDLISSLDSKEASENPDDLKFTIFFKELNGYDAKGIDDSLSDLDISLSSDDNESNESLDSDDLGTELSDVSFPSTTANSIPSIQKTLKAVLHNSSRIQKPEVAVDFDDVDKLTIIQKIREKNEKRKELRRLKVLKNNQLSKGKQLTNDKKVDAE